MRDDVKLVSLSGCTAVAGAPRYAQRVGGVSAMSAGRCSLCGYVFDVSLEVVIDKRWSSAVVRRVLRVMSTSLASHPLICMRIYLHRVVWREECAARSWGALGVVGDVSLIDEASRGFFVRVLNFVFLVRGKGWDVCAYMRVGTCVLDVLRHCRSLSRRACRL